nr:MAG TPA: hypothetical protein [Caudoviricetes sp.]
MDFPPIFLYKFYIGSCLDEIQLKALFCKGFRRSGQAEFFSDGRLQRPGFP